MTIGTKSVLFGAHAFYLHPWFVALAWWRLYGFPWDPRLWVAFFVHDIGYIGKPNMDGPEGTRHPEMGARIMARLFDRRIRPMEPIVLIRCERCNDSGRWCFHRTAAGRWGQFTLLHSRHYAKQHGKPFSQLAVADKLAFCLTPRWLYLPMVTATGEIREYMAQADTIEGRNKGIYAITARGWHSNLSRYFRAWVDEHRDGKADTWTPTRRGEAA